LRGLSSNISRELKRISRYPGKISKKDILKISRKISRKKISKEDILKISRYPKDILRISRYPEKISRDIRMISRKISKHPEVLTPLQR